MTDASSPAGVVRTLVAVRHAEVDVPPSGPDPSLTTAGRARARLLARMLDPSPVAGLIVSDALRTQQTAEPTATRFGLTPVTINDLASAAADLSSGVFGDVVVAVGHSNTVPDLLAALGLGTVPAIGAAEFDNLYVVTLPPMSGPGGLVHLRYGA